MSEETELLLSSIYEITTYLGIVGFVLLFFAALVGLRYIKIRPKYKVHRRVGITGGIAMTIHSLFMLFWKFLLPIFY
jgi:VIT1/CCC1 family predicted Fe2+/Mn2+ transporter